MAVRKTRRSSFASQVALLLGQEPEARHLERLDLLELGEAELVAPKHLVSNLFISFPINNLKTDHTSIRPFIDDKPIAPSKSNVSPAPAPRTGPITPQEIRAALPIESINALLKLFPGRVGKNEGQMAQADFVRVVRENCQYGPNKSLLPRD